MSHKRGNGEGSIAQLADGRWQARATIDGRRRAFYGLTRDMANRKMIKAIGASQRGLPVPSEKETVKTYLTRWLEDVCKNSVRPSSFAVYTLMAERYILPNIGRTRLARLSAQDLATLYRDLQAGGLSPTTVRLAHTLLHRALKQAERWNLIARNPAGLVDPPRRAETEGRILSAEQCLTLLEATHDDSLHALYAVAILGGLRSGEILGLKWEDVDWEAGAVQVRRQLTRTKVEGFHFSEPKTKRARRTVTLPAMAMDALKRHRAAQIKERLAAVAWEDNGLVFCNQVGRPMERQNIRHRHFKPLLKRLKLPDVRFHDLRHSSATLLLTLGEHPKVVQERLGHASITITMDIYSHVMPTLQRQAADKLEGMFPVAPAVAAEGPF